MYPEIIPRLKAAYLFTANELHFDSYQFGKDVCKKSHSEESEVLILSFNGICCCRKIIFRERANLDKVNPAVI